ncbi:MAG: hypothetical protein WA715_19735 [Candidatus Acidiferrum sp.]|jgi:hypothetical protein
MEREAKAVFVGEVIEEHGATPEELSHHAAPFVFRMRVERYWKGVKTPKVIGLKIAEKYLAYAVG